MTLLPKPQKNERRRANLNTADMPFSKSHFDRSGDYKAWIRTHRCLMFWYSPCEGAVESAHMQRGGRSIKGSDYSCIPLCGRNHHKLLDGNALDFEVEKFLWMRCWEFVVEWMRKGRAA